MKGILHSVLGPIQRGLFHWGSPNAEVLDLQRRLDETDARLRRLLIDSIVDGEIAVGARKETERTETAQALSDKNKYPEDSLRELRRVLAVVLFPEAQFQRNPEQGYIQ